VNIKQLFDLKNRVALITGGAGYLGWHMVAALAEAGSKVVIADAQLDRAREVAQDLRSHQLQVDAVEYDAASEDSIKAMVSKVYSSYGGVDILINGAYKFIEHRIDEATAKDFDETLRVGVTGYFLVSQKVAELMKQKGAGSIINIASMYGFVGSYPEVYKGLPACISPNYHAAKGAIVQMTRYMSVYWAEHNIRVNAISPGPFPQDKVRQTVPEMIPRLEKKVPLGRIGRPEELKGAIVFLASDASSYVTGHNLVVDGGWTAW
jgi:NAD(P)-dependent dehydrogenase (short-subunit alcohol dehydrogenase family)